MGDLSLKGIFRRYKGLSTPFSVKGYMDISGNKVDSLSLVLSSVATDNQAFGWVERCGTNNFGGTAKWLQIWTHIIVRINLNFDAGISNTTRSNLMTTWKNAIENAWSLKWGCRFDGESTCRLTFEVQWTNNNPHHNVAVTICNPGMACRENHQRWFDTTLGRTAAHEFGHLLGLKDEYVPTDPTECPPRNPVNTGTVMDTNNVDCIPARLMQRFAEYTSSNIVPIAEYNNPASCT